MKTRNAVKKYGPKLAAFGAGAVGTVGSAVAAVPAGVATTISAMQEDFETVFGATFAVMLFITGAMIAWRYVRKLGNKI